VADELRGKLRGPEFYPWARQQPIQIVVGFGNLGHDAEILFILYSVVVGGDVGHRARFEPALEFAACDIAVDDHFVEAGRQAINHVEITDDFAVFLFGDGAGDKDSEVADLLVNDVNDDLPVPPDVLHGAVYAGNPIERLLGRRDVVAHRRENQNRAFDIFQVELPAFLQFQLAALQLVADKEIADNVVDFFVVHHEEAAPPFFKVEIAVLFRVHVRINVILLGPVCIGRIQQLHVQHQVCAVEHAVAQIAEERIHPNPAQKASPVAHGIDARHAAPVGKRRAVERQGAGDARFVRAGQRGRPARLAVADDGRRVRVGMQFGDYRDELFNGEDDIRQRLAGNRVGVKQDKINRMAVVQGHADFRIALGAPDAGAVARPRIDDDDRPFGDVGTFPERAAAVLPVGIDVFAAAFGNADQRVIDGPLEMLGVQDHFVVERQDRRLTAADVLDVIVASLAQNVQKNDRTLRGIDEIVVQMLLPVRPGRGLCAAFRGSHEKILLYSLTGLGQRTLAARLALVKAGKKR